VRALPLIRIASIALALAALSAAPPAEAVVVERIVAVVGDEAIFFSQLRKRGEPFQRLILKQVPAGAQRAAAESQMYRDLLTKMIEEELEEQAAVKAKVVVAAEEIDGAIRTLAAQQGSSVPELIRTIEAKSGITEIEYRDEVRRQVLEGKMLSLRVKGRIRITEEEVRSAYQRALREERDRREYRPAWVVLRILPGSSPQAIAEREALAAEIAAKARAGEDFGELVKRFSDDSATRDRAGDLGFRAPQRSPAAISGRRPVLARELEEAIAPLEPLEVTDPVRYGDAIVVVKLLSRQPSRYQDLESARPEMMQRLQNELLLREKEAWIEDLKRRTYVDVRL
jgi:peptidyl-prolyl cis-trans isomerase SurA